MSAETLRRASGAIRKDQDINEQLGRIYDTEYAAWLAVANWLDACAAVLDASPSAAKAHAFKVARAYLGDTA